MPSILDIVDFSTLPAPNVIDTPEFETIFGELLAQFRLLDPAYTFLTEADPVAKVLEAWAYREIVLRTRINSAAKANLLAFAVGGDLDALAAWHGVTRLVVQRENLTTTPVTPLILEDDGSFRLRIQMRILAYSTAGGVAHYRFWALSASPDVLDARVYSPDDDNGYNMGGQVNIVILSRLADLIPTDALLDTVRAVVMREDVRVVSDLLVVEAAIPVPVNITASVKLLPRTPKSVFNGLEDLLSAAFANAQALGMDVTLSWLYSVLQQVGVHSVSITAPAADVTVPPNSVATLGTVSLAFDGYSDGEPMMISEMEMRRTQRSINETYKAYAITAKRTKDQIKADLALAPTDGILRPDAQTFAVFIGVDNTKDDQGIFFSDDDLCYLIWRKLSQSYLP